MQYDSAEPIMLTGSLLKHNIYAMYDTISL